MNEDLKFEKSLNLWFWLGVCFTVVILLSLIGGFLNAQQLEKPIEGVPEANPLGVVDSKLEFLKEDIIDSQEVPVYECDKEMKCTKTLLKEVQYFYAGEITPKIIKDEGDYSYTEQIGANSYRIYTAPFIKDGDTYRTLEIATTSVMHWYEQVEMEAKDPISKLWDPLFIETHAQSVPTESNDESLRCDPSANNWPTSRDTCDTAVYKDGLLTFSPVWTSDWNVARFYMRFDLSGISGTLDSADLHLFYDNTWTPGTGGVLYVNGANLGTDYGIEDYNALGRSNGTEFTIDDTTDGAEYVIPVESDLITLATNTDLAVVTDNDYLESETADNPLKMHAFKTSETTGTEYDPFLEITLGEETGTNTPETATGSLYFLLSMNDAVSFTVATLSGFLLILVLWYAFWPV